MAFWSRDTPRPSPGRHFIPAISPSPHISESSWRVSDFFVFIIILYVFYLYESFRVGDILVGRNSIIIVEVEVDGVLTVDGRGPRGLIF